MKLEQLRYILEIYRTGSISKAAKKLFLSQPNISSSIRNLEQELGFDILVRNVQGAQFTPQGMKLLRHCQNVQDELDAIISIPRDTEQLSFSLVCPIYPPAQDAFRRLCETISSQNSYRMSMFHAYQKESIRLLADKEIDLSVIISYNMSSTSMQRKLQECDLTYTPLYKLPMVLRLSKNHPLLSDPNFSLDKLRDYPFVECVSDLQVKSPYREIPNFSFINFSKYIRIETGGAQRSEIISSGTAYGIGARLPASHSEKYGLRCIPLPDVVMEMGYIRSASQPIRQVEQTFLSLLNEEMQFLKSSE